MDELTALFSRKDMTFEEAVAYFKERVPVTASRFYQIAAEYRALAFTVSGYTKAQVLKKFYDELLAALEEGSLAEFRENMNDFLEVEGYRVGITVPVDDESEKEFSYYFKRPTVPSYDRYIKTAAQGITKASKAFMLDAVIDEDAERLTKDMEENPGIAISIGNKLTEILGLTGTANLKKL